MRSTIRRAVLAVLAAVPTAALHTRADPLPPIHAAIAAHRHAVAAYESAVEISAAMDDDDPAAAAVTRRAMSALEDAGVALLAVAPTTLAGLAALLEHIATCARYDAGVWQPSDRPVEAGGEYQRADLEEHTEPIAYIAIGAAAEAIRRLAGADLLKEAKGLGRAK